jgi:Arc/MetJ-type ribon-helix-helix transcriptional regulator
MVVTTVDIPDKLLEFIDLLVSREKARNRREVILAALAFYENYEVFDWHRSQISIGGFRKAMVSYNLVEQLQSRLDSNQFYEMGRVMGLALRDYLSLNHGKDATDPANYSLGLSHISAMGWGELTIIGDTIRVDEPFMPKALLRGYIESAFGVSLKEVTTIENVAAFKILKPENVEKVEIRKKRTK